MIGTLPLPNSKSRDGVIVFSVLKLDFLVRTAGFVLPFFRDTSPKAKFQDTTEEIACAS